jgi:hypothetical protein
MPERPSPPTKAEIIALTFADHPHPPALAIEGRRERAIAWPVPFEEGPACVVAFTDARDCVRIALLVGVDAASLSSRDVAAIAFPFDHRTFGRPTVFSGLASNSYNDQGGRTVSKDLPALMRSLAAPDPAAVSAMGHCASYDAEVWLWLSDPVGGPRARDFARRHPWLARAAAARKPDDRTPADASIDAWATSLCGHYLEVPKVWNQGDTRLAIEALRGLVLPCGPVHLDDPYVAGVAHMPRSHWPSRRDGHAPQADLAHACASATGRSVPSVIGPMGGWAAYAARMHGRSGLAETYVPGRHDRIWDEASRPVAAINDMVEAFAEQVVRPAAVMSGDAGPVGWDPNEIEIRGLLGLGARSRGGVTHSQRAGALRLLTGDRTLPRLAEVSARWHARASAIQRAIAALPACAEARGPVAFDPVDLGDGITGRCLTDAAALLDEGSAGFDADGVRGLDHCVGSYLPRVLAGTSHIVSIRMGQGPSARRLSTAELTLANGRYRVLQHMGRRNAPPGEAAEGALARLIPMVEDGARAVASRWTPPASTALDGLAEPGSWDMVARLWDFALPKPLRGLPPEGLLAASRSRTDRTRIDVADGSVAPTPPAP